MSSGQGHMATRRAGWTYSLPAHEWGGSPIAPDHATQLQPSESAVCSFLAGLQLLALALDKSQREPLTARSWCIAPPLRTLPPGLLSQSTTRALSTPARPSVVTYCHLFYGTSSPPPLQDVPPQSHFPMLLPQAWPGCPLRQDTNQSGVCSAISHLPVLPQMSPSQWGHPRPSAVLLPGSANLATRAFICSNTPSHVLGHYPHLSLPARVPAL